MRVTLSEVTGILYVPPERRSTLVRIEEAICATGPEGVAAAELGDSDAGEVVEVVEVVGGIVVETGTVVEVVGAGTETAGAVDGTVDDGCDDVGTVVSTGIVVAGSRFAN